jgi:hypothetical protein
MSLPQIKVEEAQDLRKLRPDCMMSARERAILVTLLREISAKTVIEIGVHEGRCAEIILLNVPTIVSYVGIDVERGYVPSKPSQRMEIPAKPGEFAVDDVRFTLITRPRGSLDLSHCDLPMCDAMIIDGDHGREAVVHDTKLAAQLVYPCGTTIWHDYHPDGDPVLDVSAMLEQFAMDMRIEHIQDTWLAIMRA